MYEFMGRNGLECGLTRVECDTGSGTFDVFHGETAIFAKASAGSLMRRGKKVSQMITEGPWQVDEARGGGISLSRIEEWGKALLEINPIDGDGISVRAGLLWESGDEPPGVEAIAPLKVPAGGIWSGRREVKQWKAYVHGWQCWTPTAALSSSRPGDHPFPLFLPKSLKAMLANPTTPVSSVRGRFQSEWFTAIADTERRDSVVVGFTGITEALSRVSVGFGRKPADSELEAFSVHDGVRLERGVPFFSEPLVILPGDLSCSNLEEYARMLASAQGARPSHAPAGWCSWYQYKAGIDEKQVMMNLADIDGQFSYLDIGLIQIDDGYSPNVGDWLEHNERFPDGVEPLAKSITGRGRMPGIWLAPFTVTRGSKIFKEKKEWLQCDAKGKPVMAGVSPDWGGRFYGLDLTHPDVLDWLGEVFSTLAGYGYSFFKLDFLGCGLLEGKRRDDTVTRAQAARKALRVIREAAGEDAYIMAAGGPVLIGTGILDAQRISGDVAPFWSKWYQRAMRDRATPGVRNSLINTLTRSFMSGRLFEGDPDCLLARTTDSELTDAEKKTLASAIAALGGSFMVSDDTARWGPDQLLLLSRCLPLSHGVPVCTDLWRREVPMYLRSALEDPSGEYFLGLAVNWTGSTVDLKIDLAELDLPEGRWHVCEFWTGQYLGEVADSVVVKSVPAHGCALARFTKAEDRPGLIGSSINASQGASELKSFEPRDDGVTMELHAPIGGEAHVTLAMPGGGEMGAKMLTETEGRDTVDVERLSTTVYRISFEMPAGSTRIALMRQ